MEEAEEKRRDQQRFMALNPFRTFPASDCLRADPWREQAAAQVEFDRMMRIREKEEDAEKATVGRVKDLAAETRDQIDGVYVEVDFAKRQLRELEDRLRAVMGPLPELPIEENYWD